MTLAETMTGLALAISAANCLLLFLTWKRAAAWKEGEEAQALIRRLDKCVNDIAAIKSQGQQGDALAARLGLAEGDITGLKARMENVATKADVARLTAEMTGIERQVLAVEGHAKRIEGGVDRIEGFLMNNAARGHA
ncbi:hypothetical protein JIP62_10505 [Brevundimonas vitis]|uniref:Chemotaxis protein n=1 Tax=Brevundimonas vitisensis TaxID=2800818 RepID=A0ABX7BLN1_9CAUL|nr:hypothetical protein [Brevundimonas vitisensis]QQQ17763.1 hypothetical protein JIP62_10505 [Brevundimonas vitisensis]